VHGHFALSELGMLLYRGTRAAVCPCCLRSYDFIEASQTLTAATSEPRRGVSSRGQPDSRGGAAAATRAAAQPRDADAAHGRARLADAARGCSADAPPRPRAGRVARPQSCRGRADPDTLPLMEERVYPYLALLAGWSCSVQHGQATWYC